MIVLRLLNDCTILVGDRRITPNAKVLFSLAIYLVVERGKIIPRHVLTSLFWPHVSVRAARHSFRRALWQLRQYGFPIMSENDMNVFMARDAAQLDLDTLDQEPDALLATRTFEILPWFTPRGSQDFRDWVDDLKYVVRTRIVLHLTEAASRAKTRTDWQSVVDLSEHALKIDPDNAAARANLTRARQFLRSRYLPRMRSLPQLLVPAASAPRPVQMLGESSPPTYAPALQQAYASFHQTATTVSAEDLEMLLTVLTTTLDGQGTCLQIWGDEQTGTNELIQELLAVADAKGALTLMVTLNPQHARFPLAAIATIIDPLQNAPGAAGCDPHLKQLLSALSAKLARRSIPPRRRGSTLSSHSPLSPHLFSGFLDLIQAVADEQPLVVVFEHMHNIDASSRDLLDQLIPQLTTQPILLICTATTPTEALTSCTHAIHIRANERHVFPIANEAYDCVANTERPIHQRLEAGVALCTLAAAMGDATRVRYAQHMLLPFCAHQKPSDSITPQDMLPSLRFEAISHALIGDASIALQQTRQILDIIRPVQRETELLDTLLFCAEAFHRSGSPDQPTKLYLETFSRATHMQSPVHAMQAAQGLTRIFLDRNDAKSAATWLERTLSFVPNNLSLWERHTIQLLQIQVAIAQTDTVRAAHLFFTSPDLLSAPLLGVQVSAKAAYLRMLLLQGTPFSVLTQKAEELILLSTPLRYLRVYHYEFFSLYLAYNHLNSPDIGMRILNEYLELSHPSPLLPSHEMRIAAQRLAAEGQDPFRNVQQAASLAGQMDAAEKSTKLRY